MKAVLASAAVALLSVVAAGCGGSGPRAVGKARPPTITCNDVIGNARSGHNGGYRVVLGVVSVPPARLRQVVATHSRPWAYWRKAGLVVRASKDPITVSVPKAWRARAAITWGGSGTVSSLRIVPCTPPPRRWNAYAGGFYLRERHECVPLTVTVGGRSRTVRFGVGEACSGA